MNGVRTAVYDTLRNAPSLVALGLATANLYPNYTGQLNAPTLERWAVLRWGGTTPGVGPANLVDLGLWAYCRQPDYGWISDVLKAARPVLEAMIGGQAGSGWFIGVQWVGASADLFDDGYTAYTRNETYRITASGS